MSDSKKKPLVLIVDDVPDNIQVLAVFLAERGFEVEIALNGRSALEVMQSIKPDLILLDIMMPGMDGYEVCSIIKSREETRNIPVIFLTAKTDIDDIVKAFECGGVDFISKPFNKLELYARVKTHLELKFARETIENNASLINEINKELIEISRVKDQYLEQINFEIQNAAQYVRSLLPNDLHEDFADITWEFEPSARLGGDALGYHFIDKENLAIYLIDVSGHGISSALQSVSVLNVLKFRTLPEVDFHNPGEVLSSLNRVFQSKDHHFLFLTMWYAVYNIPHRTLRYASAGHPHPVIISKDFCQVLDVNNIVIGALPSQEYMEGEVSVHGEADLFIFSDGAFEVRTDNGKIWGIEALYNFLVQKNREKADEMAELKKYIFELTGRKDFQDDFSMMKVSLHP